MANGRNTEAAKMLTFRCPPDVLRILQDLQAHSGVDRTEVIVSLLRVKGREILGKLPPRAEAGSSDAAQPVA